MKTMLSFVAPVGLGLMLGACGSSDVPPLTQVAGAVLTQITSGGDAPDVRAQLTPEVVAAIQQPFLLVDVPARDATATMALFAATGNRADWRTGDGTSVVMVDDIVIATRGLGADLFLAETGDLRAVLANGSGTILRRHTLLDGENREFTQSYSCTISDAGLETINLLAGNIVSRKTIEACRSEDQGIAPFTNTYWTSQADGLIWQSNQWVSDEVGYVVLAYVKR